MTELLTVGGVGDLLQSAPWLVVSAFFLVCALVSVFTAGRAPTEVVEVDSILAILRSDVNSFVNIFDQSSPNYSDAQREAPDFVSSDLGLLLSRYITNTARMTFDGELDGNSALDSEQRIMVAPSTFQSSLPPDSVRLVSRNLVASFFIVMNAVGLLVSLLFSLFHWASVSPEHLSNDFSFAASLAIIVGLSLTFAISLARREGVYRKCWEAIIELSRRVDPVFFRQDIVPQFFDQEKRASRTLDTASKCIAQISTIENSVVRSTDSLKETVNQIQTTADVIGDNIRSVKEAYSGLGETTEKLISVIDNAEPVARIDASIDRADNVVKRLSDALHAVTQMEIDEESRDILERLIKHFAKPKQRPMSEKKVRKT